MGGATKRHPESAWDLIGQDNHWEVPKRPRINTRTPPLNPLLNPRSSASLNFSLDLSLSLSGKMNSLFSSGPHPASLIPWKEENPLSLFTSFYSLTLVYFLSVSSCAKLCLPNTTSPRLCKTSQRPLQRLLNSKPISDFGKPFPEKTENKGNPLNTKATQVQTPDFAVPGVILKIEF